VKEYQAAFLGAAEAGGVDTALLQLKIADLSSAASPPTADPSNKAKP
jgi:hypothetical protein